MCEEALVFSAVRIFSATLMVSAFSFSFSRIPISQTYIEMVIGRLRSDDIYNQVGVARQMRRGVVSWQGGGQMKGL